MNQTVYMKCPNYPDDAESLSPFAIATGIVVRIGSAHDKKVRYEFQSGKTQLTEVGLRLSLLGSEPLLMIISKQLVEEINRFIRYISLVLRGDEPRPRLPGIPRISI